MVDIKVGMYARINKDFRTICLGVGKIVNIVQDTIYLDMNMNLPISFEINKVAEASYNILDLIEKGDYVNGYKILDIVDVKDSNEKAITIFNHKGTDVIYFYSNEDIKSIVTKEQFENMKYKVE